jgi:uncharacterized phage protein (TIGR01671 family)
MKQFFKFRGFYKDEPVYFTFDTLMGNSLGVPCVFVKEENDPIRDGIYVSIHLLENITQFTGLKDKNNVEIYGGDICKKYDGQSGYAFYFSGEWILKTFDSTDDFPYGSSMYCGSSHKSETDVVIGNIYQNPNLTK